MSVLRIVLKVVLSVIVLLVGGYFSLIIIAGVHSGGTVGEIVFGGSVGLFTLAVIVSMWWPRGK